MKQHLQLLYILLLTTIVNITFAQTKDSNTSIGKVFINDVEQFFDLGIELAKSPFTARTSNYYITGAVVGTTALLFTVDKTAKTFALSNQSVISNKIFGIDKYYGSAYTAVFTTAIYGYGLFAEDSRIRKLGFNTSTAFIYASTVTGIIKVLLGRRRPYAGTDNLHFKPFHPLTSTYHSLPSGHTTAAFAVSTVMANYSDNTYWKLFWYGSAGIVGLARIYHNKHWISDGFLGAAIGYSVGSFVVNFDKSKTEYLGVRVTPYFSFNSIGVNFKF